MNRLVGAAIIPFIHILLAAPVVYGDSAGPAVTQRALSSGAALLVSEQRNLPIVQIHVLVDAGARRDPAGGEGLANLTASLLTEGTAQRSAAEVSDAIEFVGGSLSASAGMDYAAISLKVLRQDLELGLDLLADVLLRPAFARDELERQREAALASIRAAEDNPASVAGKAFQHTLFAGEPYAHPVVGTSRSVAAIEQSAVRAFYEAHYGPGAAGVIVVGDIDADTAESVLEASLASWRGRRLVPFDYPAAAVDRPRQVLIDRSVKQASIILGRRGIARSDPDFEVLKVMNYVLGGGGFSSRLMDEIRTKAGLVYSVYSSFDAYRDAGSFEIAMQTKNGTAVEAMEMARGEVEKFRRDGITQEELDDAIRYLTGSFPLQLDSSGEIALFIARVWFYDLGFDFVRRHLDKIRSVTREDVRRAAQKYLTPELFLEVVVADLEAAGLSASGSPAQPGS
jgi:zinc protease